MTDKFNSFVELAKQKYRITLTSVEKKLLKAIVKGEVADYQVKSPELDNPAQAESWGEERILSAEFIYWLCTDVEAFPYFTNHGLQVRGAKISGELNLEFVKFESLLYLTECIFTEKIILRGAKVEEVKFDGSHVVGIDAELIEVRGSLYLRNGFQSKGELRLSEANIGAQLLCTKGHFFNKEGTALNAQNIKVKADIFIRNGFKAEGIVILSQATIGGQLDCTQGHFSNKEEYALIAENTEIKGSVFLRNGFKAEGIVILSQANIGGQLDCHGGHFSNKSNKEEYALIAQNIEVKSSVFLSDDFKAEGIVILSQATIGGQLNCTQGHFSNQEGYALIAQNIEVKGSVFLSDDFKAEGEVNLSEATIGGQLACCGGRFYNQGKDALIAKDIEVKGSVFLSDDFKAEGEVNLSEATIGGQLACRGGHFYNQGKDALIAESLEIKGSVFMREAFNAEGRVSLSGATIGGQLDCSQGNFSNTNKGGNALFAQNIEVKTNIILSNGFKAEGAVDLTAANIKGNLDCTNGNFYNEKDNVLSARKINVEGDIILDEATFKGNIYLVSARVDGTLSMLQIKESKQMKLDLQFARIACLKDDEQSWPQQNNLKLDGFIYQKFSTDNNIPKDSNTRYKWLRLQPDFFPQTYEQLAEVFKKEGDPDAAREILIRKKRDIKPKLNCLGKFWNCILDVTIVYGYQPATALIWSSIFILAGFYFFNLGYENCAELISNNKCLFSPSSRILPYIKDEKNNNNKKIDIDYPEFNSFWYSLDTFVPIVDLHQQTYWLPNPKKSGKIPLILFKVKIGEVSGPRLRLYLWVHIIFGWILTSLWVAGFSGLVRG